MVFLAWRFCPNRDEGEKYILEVDPEDDIRENIMNYDEEGAGKLINSEAEKKVKYTVQISYECHEPIHFVII